MFSLHNVDKIVDRMEQLPVINKCYQTWWELQCQVENFYSERERQRPPLSEQKEFRSVKNAVIQEAENIYRDKVTFEVKDIEESTTFSDCHMTDGSCGWSHRMIPLQWRTEMKQRNTVKAEKYLAQSTEAGNQYAQYTLSKLYLERQNLEQAHYWFLQSAAQGNEYAQFFLDR